MGSASAFSVGVRWVQWRGVKLPPRGLGSDSRYADLATRGKLSQISDVPCFFLLQFHVRNVFVEVLFTYYRGCFSEPMNSRSALLRFFSGMPITCWLSDRMRIAFCPQAD